MYTFLVKKPKTRKTIKLLEMAKHFAAVTDCKKRKVFTLPDYRYAA